MAIKGGEIFDIGPEREILNKYRSDQFINAKGNTVYPGFIDSYCDVNAFSNKFMGKSILNLQDSEKQEMLQFIQKKCFSVGITTVSLVGLNKSLVDLIDTMHMDGSLKLNVYGVLADEDENFNFYKINGPYETEKLNIRSFNIHLDGSIRSYSAALKEPYADTMTRGETLYNHKSLLRKAKLLDSIGFQLNTYCVGDKANELALEVYAKALEGMNNKRWRIEHAGMVDSKDHHHFKDHSIIASVHPLDAIIDMESLDKRIGHRRLKTTYAYKQLFELNRMIVLGSGIDISEVNPVNNFYAAVVRKSEVGFPANGFQIENALTRDQAIRAMTFWGAMANFEEDKKGSLEKGKQASFVILNGDLLVVSPEKMLNISVVKTIVDGQIVFERE